MPDETIESLKQAFMKDKDNISNECPMADQISESAFGELDPEKSKDAEEHLKSCRSCLDLFMDIRTCWLRKNRSTVSPTELTS